MRNLQLFLHCILVVLVSFDWYRSYALIPSLPFHYPVISELSSREHLSALLSDTKSAGQKLSVFEGLIHSNERLEVLSFDPLVYLVHNVLSAEECQSYINHVKNLTKTSNARSLTTSNPPQVTLVKTKLWPLPFLSVLAGVPTLIRQLNDARDSHSLDWYDILYSIAPPIVAAFLFSCTMAAIAIQLLQRIVAPASRTSDVIALNQQEDIPFIRPLVERACRISNGHPWTCFEAPVVTRYRTGAVFTMHNDASPTLGSEWSELGGQRVVTTIFYLNSCNAGGATSFDKLGIAVQPRQGSALVFFPADKRTLEADERTRHESTPAVEEKWIVQMFGRIGPRVPPPLGIPDKFEELYHLHDTTMNVNPT